MKRRKVKRRADKAYFARTANRQAKANVITFSRGGVRL